MTHASGFILWLTGLSGAGKSTLAGALRPLLVERGHRVEVLDGDELRQNLSQGLGFSKADRDTNIRRIGYVANLLARNGVVAITAAISPYRSIRDEVRAKAEVPFVEIHVDAPLEVVEQRDVKGLYQQARSGALANMTGVSDPYEAPLQPELVIKTGEEPVEASAARVLAHLRARGLVR